MPERQEPVLDTSPPAPAPPAAVGAAAASPKPGRWWRRLVVAGVALLLVLATGLAGLWWWSGRDQSLAQTLALAQRWLPAGLQLEVEDVQGSLRFGGEIGSLRLSDERFKLEIKQLTIAWNLGQLLQRRLATQQLAAAAVHYRAQPDAPQDNAPSTPLHTLLLPLDIDLPVRIDTITWADDPSAQLEQLDATYRYQRGQHTLELARLHYGPQQAVLSASVQLNGQAPMQLAARAQARATPALALAQPLVLQAQVQIDGTLSGPQAQLQVSADVQPEGAATSPAAQAATDSTQADTTTVLAEMAQLLSARLQATVAPWQAQPLPQAQLDVQHLNLAWFDPALPPSDVSGQLHIRTDADGIWRLSADLANPQAGAWDAPALPLEQLQAQAQFDGSQWAIEQLRWQLPTGPQGQPGGQLQAQGQWSPATQALATQVQLQAINPAHLLASLPSQSVSGEFTAHTTTDTPPTTDQTPAAADVLGAPDASDASSGSAIAPEATSSAIAPADRPAQAQGATAPAIDFHLALSAPNAPSQGLEQASAQGRWADGLLALRQVAIRAWGAELVSPSLTWDSRQQQVASPQTTRLQLPGLQAELTGTLAEHAGQGQLRTHWADAAATMQWLARLPGLVEQAPALTGQAQVDLAWQGGWGRFLSSPVAPAEGEEAIAARAASIELLAKIPHISYTQPAQEALQIKDLTLALNGPLDKLQASLNGQVLQGSQQAHIDTRWLAQWHNPSSWQLQAQALTLLARPGAKSGDWRLALHAPVTVAQQGTHIEASAGTLQLTPPATGGEGARIQWSTLSLDTTTGGLLSQGELTGLPLAWADYFTPDDPVLERAGLSGDLRLQGRWDIDTRSAQPKLHATVERADGDIRIAANMEEAAPVTIIRSQGTDEVRTRLREPNRGRRMRLQTLQATLDLEGNILRGQVLWASERAGTILANLQSPLQHSTRQGWSWPEQAPLSGTVQLLLPNIGVWASFAPPGWRVEGGFSGAVAISGTRSAPQWEGQIEAEDLALSSLLDGVNLKNGVLQARFAGNRLDIERLTLEGDHSGQARVLGQSGNRTAPPESGGRLSGRGFIVYDPPADAHSNADGLQMDVQVQLDDLQVLTRADRQMGVSGQIHASMVQEQLRLRGGLTVNRAALLLADDSAPSLDEDVHLTSAALRQEEAARQAKEARKAARNPAPEGSLRAALKPDTHLTLDLGPDFALQGYGLTTRLNGQLTIQGGPQVTGEIHTEQGRYRAWGQALDIEQGTIRFNGPYANPSLDIIALRPNIAVKAGVKVAGSATMPRVQLYSDPAMPDGETLSWVVMGRDPTEGGAESALLQQAALALLSGSNNSGNIAGNIGLDELGFKGANGAEGAALTLGKRISQDLYLAYEQSLNGAMGTLFVFYDLTKRLTLRGQTGEKTAMDLIYTRRKD